MAVLRRRLIRAIGLACVLALRVAAHAQNNAPPIHLGENVTGDISAANPVPQYALNVEAASSVVIVQLLALNDGVTGFQVIDETGSALLTAAIDEGDTMITANAALPSAGTYLIQMDGTIGGQYVISVQPGNVQPPPSPLVIGERISGTVENSAPAKVYSLYADVEHILLLSVYADFADSAPSIRLRDGSGHLLALAGSGTQGFSVRVPRGDAGYTLNVTYSGGDLANTYSVCLETEDNTARCEPYEVPPQPEITRAPSRIASPTPFPSNACVVAPSVGVYVNIRATPSLTAAAIGQLPAEGRALVTGRSADAIWWQITYDGQTGWVSGAVTVTSGLCDSIPTVEP